MKFTATWVSMLLLLFLFTACENDTNSKNDTDITDSDGTPDDDSSENGETDIQELFSNPDKFDEKKVTVCDTLVFDSFNQELMGCLELSNDCCNGADWLIGFKGKNDGELEPPGEKLFLIDKVIRGSECLPDETGEFAISDFGRELCVTGTFHKELGKGGDYASLSPYIVIDEFEFQDEKPVLDDGIEVVNELVLIEGGDFLQGLKKETVNLGDFYIQKYEVTARDYQKCIDAGICKNGIETRMYDTYENFFGCNIGSENDADNPANCISFEGAKTYCEWKGMRLPTELEREKAARGTDGRVYPWGEKTPDCTFIVKNEPYTGCGTYSTFTVGSKPAGASPYGIMDMSGNVSEWIESGIVLGGAFGDGEYDSFRFYSYNYLGIPINIPELDISNGFRCASDTAAQ